MNVRFNPDIVITLRLNLEEIYNGKKVKCHKIQRNIVQLQKGKQTTKVEDDTIDIDIECGVGQEHKIYIRSKGNKLVKDGEVVKMGNIIVIINEIAHPVFKRSQLQPLHLYMTQKISVFQALLGEFEIVLSGLNKETINFNMGKTIIKPGTVLCIKNKGMKQLNGNNPKYGDLYVIFELEFPNELNDEQRKHMKTIAGYVETKKKESSNIQWNLTTTEFLQKLLNTDERTEDENNMHFSQGQSVQCAQQ
jgi:DnaJ-class molecular chaperone